MKLDELADTVETREDLVAFIGHLKSDFDSSGETWANCDLSAFLAGMYGWAHDMEGYYLRTGEDLSSISPWRVLAHMLIAARVYE